MNEKSKIVQGGKGVLLCLLFYIAFVAIARGTEKLLELDGAAWYLFSSAQRLIFGIFELWLFVRIYNKQSRRDIIHTRGLKSAMTAGLVLIIDMALLSLSVAVGTKSFADTTLLIVVSKLLFQQMATGFWEELTFRGFVCEGYWQNGELTKKKRIIYALISFVLFGMIHAYDVLVSGDDPGWALIRFITTGTIGMAFTAMYLYSGCLLGPMIMHFIFDIPANVPGLVAEWKDNAFFNFMNDIGLYIMYAVIAAVSVVYLLKEPVYSSNDIVHDDKNALPS